LELKERSAQEALSIFKNFESRPTIESPQTGFRNRAKLTVSGSVDQPILGLIDSQGKPRGHEILACPIHHPRLNELIAALPSIIRSFELSPYQISDRSGELKGIIAFTSGTEMILRWVIRSHLLIEPIQRSIPQLQSQFPDLVCISANIQPIPHAILEGPEEVILTERSTAKLQLGEVTLDLAPQSFVQTNFTVAKHLYQTAAQWIAEANVNRVLELYCGQGAFSFASAKAAPSLLGIELNATAVDGANQTARAHGLSHLRFIQGDATQIQEQVLAFAPDLILVKAGVDRIFESRPRHLIYSSCNVQTLAKDLKQLSNHYELKRSQIFDLFPHTDHFETLVWLVKR
jgi:23S rRNA (uracil747-C5)-methyltransferase